MARPGRVLQIHTRYRQRGGEESVVEAERRLLQTSGIGVSQVIFDNADLRESRSLGGDLRLAASAVWSRAAHARVRAAIAADRPDVVHVHNTFSTASPSVYAAAADEGVPVVQTLHNYRFVCPSATAFRDGRPCTDCVGRAIPLPGVVHACVRGSRTQSAVVATTMAFHRARGTYRSIARYIALTPFQRGLMVSGGMPASQITVIPNFLERDPGAGVGPRAGVLYVGRLSVEKGIRSLVDAAVESPGLLTVVGDGPLAAPVEAAHSSGALEWIGALDGDAVFERMRAAEAVVVPSIWYEGFPLVLLEAFAAATPVIASRIGSLADLVDDGVTGLLVDPGDAAALRDAMCRIREDPAAARRIGTAARQKFEDEFGPAAHRDRLLDAYGSAMSWIRRR